MLKKQQLQMEIRKIEAQLAELRRNRELHFQEILRWIGVFAEEVSFPDLLTVTSLETDIGNIAGVDIPVFEDIRFEVAPYDLDLDR